MALPNQSSVHGPTDGVTSICSLPCRAAAAYRDHYTLWPFGMRGAVQHRFCRAASACVCGLFVLPSLPVPQFQQQQKYSQQIACFIQHWSFDRAFDNNTSVSPKQDHHVNLNSTFFLSCIHRLPIRPLLISALFKPGTGILRIQSLHTYYNLNR